MDSVAFEMGAVFLLAGMLMFGSAHGFIPRSLRNIGAPILVVGALIGFLIWRFGADMSVNARETIRSISAPGSTSRGATPEASSGETAASGKATTPDPERRAIPKQKYPSSNVIVIRDAGPTETAGPAPSTAPAASEPAVQQAAEPQTKPAAKSSDSPVSSPVSSPYDSGAKRAVRSVGRFLHIGEKKQTSAQ
jgi:hypothetical protein